MKPKVLLLTSMLFFIMACVHASGNMVQKAARCTPDKKSDINGYVIHGRNRKLLTGVSVTAYSNSKREKSAATDGRGNFSFDDLKSGNYKLVFEKSGFKKVTKENIYIKSDNPFRLNIEMTEADDFEFVPGPFHLVDF